MAISTKSVAIRAWISSTISRLVPKWSVVTVLRGRRMRTEQSQSLIRTALPTRYTRTAVLVEQKILPAARLLAQNTVAPSLRSGEDYKISSANGLNFLNNALAGERLDGGDGSHWVKNEDGTTSITDKYGIAYKVYDRGGILRGMGGIKATMQDEGITPPDVTALLRKRLLKPIDDKTFGQNMDQIRWMMASNGTSANEVHNASYDSHNIGTMIAKQINCTINGMKVSPQEAHALTLEKLANIAHNLGNFS